MTLDIPAAGSPILDTWGALVASKLNRLIPLVTTADQSVNSGTLTSITGLSFPVVSGRTYNVQLFGAYLVANTSQGLQIGFSAPALASCIGYNTMTGNASATGKTEARVTDGSALGRTATDATFGRNWWWEARFVPSADGTFQLQFSRGGANTTSPGVTIYAGSGGLAIESA